MPKTSRSEQMDFVGLEILADEFTGEFNGTLNGTTTLATTTVAGSVKKGVAVVDATDADDIVDQFNALLASLRTAGVIVT